MTAPSRTDQPHKIQPPRGTRDLYPAEAARRRWLTERWREVSVRHGFEEVDGPTFEASDLYAVKSGDGILGELFQAFSGKSPDEVEQVKETGRAPYALRPEFTPTLARMYAAKAAGLPKPCKWFMAGPFFRAERPQRGRLREFLQWNCDVLGLDIPAEKWNAEDWATLASARARMDLEVIETVVDYLESVGLDSSTCKVRYSHRGVLGAMFEYWQIPKQQWTHWFLWIDAYSKTSPTERKTNALAFGASESQIALVTGLWSNADDRSAASEADKELMARGREDLAQQMKQAATETHKLASAQAAMLELSLLERGFVECGLTEWCEFDVNIVRGLAYYTGTVFEVIAHGERAVAGGGRYDNLIELFGGPKTPAVGFAMGDVVLSLLLQDKGLMPSDDELMGLVGQHPDVFVLSSGDEAAEARVRPTVAALRRGGESLAGLHVRHSYKATKNVGKLLKEAAQQGARFAVIIEDAESCSVKDTRTNEQWPDKVPLTDLHARLAGAM